MASVVNFFIQTFFGFVSFYQLNDCHRGVVFDGLETLFAQNQFTAASAILKALNNRRFIFFITLKLDYHRLKEQEKREQEERGENIRNFHEREM